MDCGTKMAKYILFFFNFIFWLVGIALIVAGVLVEVMYKEYFAFFSGKVNTASIAIIILGIVIFIVAFFGCCGAVKENYCMIVTYTILVVFFIVALVALAVAAFFLKDEIENTLEANMIDTIKKASKESEEINTSWKHVQKTLGCCGVNSYTDWKQNALMKNTVPDSCCIIEKENCGKFTDVETIHKTGCVEKLKTMSENNIILLGVLASIFAVILFLGVITGSCLACAVKKDYEAMK